MFTVKPTNAPSTPVPGTPVHQTTASSVMESPQHRQRSETSMVNIGKSVVIKGELEGSEDLTIEGRIEGSTESDCHAAGDGT